MNPDPQHWLAVSLCYFKGIYSISPSLIPITEPWRSFGKIIQKWRGALFYPSAVYVLKKDQSSILFICILYKKTYFWYTKGFHTKIVTFCSYVRLAAIKTRAVCIGLLLGNLRMFQNRPGLLNQCSGSMTFWYRTGWDQHLWLTDLGPANFWQWP
jgi:hypothetical protein